MAGRPVLPGYALPTQWQCFLNLITVFKKIQYLKRFKASLGFTTFTKFTEIQNSDIVMNERNSCDVQIRNLFLKN